ncbi:AcrR family transcriptional regulator [Microbacterium terrae]|uniref:Bacterial regulatory protein, tetR family n=1 Tax=Microbacterium terrae TaxID=69369 RepID=A0A0M2HHZ3_9MICO|nr:TetR/AcrR family transcriptional regulator [Microbacterium terrae]KJL43920.1 Bacterial regulatory protein, tetR family [Microbacterium terrae]MBP1078671.1 AcrR family transcriptional regulator [Microbacterium terrae]GLJ98072.1 TetR family transcriptional regulator [Microbacterium terrae]
MRSPVGEGRDRLLQALFDDFGESGPSPKLSMRQIAERVGVHHTLLTYHFGSRPGLLAAVLSEARRRDNDVIAAADADLGYADMCRALWRLYADGAHEDRSRAFFHLVGLAVYERDAFEEFVTDIDDLRQLIQAAALRDGSTPTDAAQLSILATSVLRGLLLQRLLAPSADVDAAAERFLASLSAPTEMPANALDGRQAVATVGVRARFDESG